MLYKFELCYNTTDTTKNICVKGTIDHSLVTRWFKKFCLDPCCNLTVRKNDEHAKSPSWFTNSKAYLLLHILVIVEKRETVYEN